MVSVDETSNTGTRKKLLFYTLEAYQIYEDKEARPVQEVSLSGFLEEFRAFPQVDEVLTIYFDESIKCVENKQRLAPSILVGCLSELLVLRLLEAVGDYLEDPNAVSNFKEKRRDIQRQLDYTREMARKGREKLEQTTTLSQPQRRTFTEFNNILEQVFNSIRLRRNECVHPSPNMTLDELPSEEVVRAHVTSFNPFAKVILGLINIFKETA